MVCTLAKTNFAQIHVGMALKSSRATYTSLINDRCLVSHRSLVSEMDLVSDSRLVSESSIFLSTRSSYAIFDRVGPFLDSFEYLFVINSLLIGSFPSFQSSICSFQFHEFFYFNSDLVSDILITR